MPGREDVPVIAGRLGVGGGLVEQMGDVKLAGPTPGAAPPFTWSQGCPLLSGPTSGGISSRQRLVVGKRGADSNARRRADRRFTIPARRLGGISIPRGHAAKPQALSPEQFLDLHTKILAWEQEPALGRNRSQELHEIADFLISTGLRSGELFALRWDDINLEADPPTVRPMPPSSPGLSAPKRPPTRRGIRRSP